MKRTDKFPIYVCPDLCGCDRGDRRRGGDRRGQHRGRRARHVPGGTAGQCRQGERAAHTCGVRELGGADVRPQGGREPRPGRPAQGRRFVRPADRRGDTRGDGARGCRGARRDDVRGRAVARRDAETRAGRAADGRAGPRRRVAEAGAAGGQCPGGGRGGGYRRAGRREPEGGDGAAERRG